MTTPSDTRNQALRDALLAAIKLQGSNRIGLKRTTVIEIIEALAMQEPASEPKYSIDVYEGPTGATGDIGVARPASEPARASLDDGVRIVGLTDSGKLKLKWHRPASERCDHPMDVRCVRCDPVGVAQSGKGHAPKHTIVEPASEPAPASDEISPYEWMAREFERLAILRKMWNALEVSAILRRYDIERPSEPAPASAPSCHLGKALEKIEALDESMGHNLKVEHAFEAVAIAASALRARAQPCQYGELRARVRVQARAIDRLEQSLAATGALREALEPFARLAGVLVDGDADDGTVIGVTVADLRRARAILAMQEPASEPAAASAPQNWVVRKNGYFYRPNSRGYTASILEAGRYTREEAEAHAAASSGEVTAHPASDFPAPAPAPSEWVMVPRQPTEAMITAGHQVMAQALIDSQDRRERQRIGYLAMVEAAPASAPSCCGAALEKATAALKLIASQNERPSNSPDPAHEHYLRTVLIALAKKGLEDSARAQPCQCGELREAAERVVKLRVGELPSKGWLPDNDATRLALHELAAATAPRSGESHE